MKQMVFILLSFVGLNAFAVDPTQGPLQQDPSLCSYGYNPNCNTSSGTAGHKIIHLPSKYGAVAVSTSKSYIDSVENAASRNEAKKEAKQRCEQGSNSACKVIYTYANGCVATADGVRRSKHMAFANAAENKSDAEDAALRKCNKYGASNCKIVMPAQCSLP